MAFWFSMNIRPKRRSTPFARTAREQAMVEWRRIDLREVEGERGEAKPAASVLPKVLETLGLDRRRAETEILKVWNYLMDPHIVQHSQPSGLVRGTLFVTVDSHVWLDEIVRYRRHEILERLRTSFGQDLILKMCFRVG